MKQKRAAKGKQVIGTRIRQPRVTVQITDMTGKAPKYLTKFTVYAEPEDVRDAVLHLLKDMV